MSNRIAELSRELLALTDNPPTRPTREVRNKLMTVRDKIKSLPVKVELTESEETDRRYLYVVATQEANRQEDFWEQNGKKWADE
jgi:hypothetical protein